MAGARPYEDTSHLGDAPGAGSAAYPKPPARKSGFIDGDATTMPGQYGDDLFGVPLPQASAPGTGGADSGGDFGGQIDPSNEPGQYPPREPVTGVAIDYGGSGAFQPEGTEGAQPGDGTGTAKAMTVTGVDLMANIPRPVTGAVVDGTGDWTSTPGYYPDNEEITGVPLPHAQGAARGDFQAAGGQVWNPGRPNNMNELAGDWAPQPVPDQGGRPRDPGHPNNEDGLPLPQQIQGQVAATNR